MAASNSMFSSVEYPVSVLYNRVPPSAHYHIELEFSLVLRGHGQYFVRDRIYDLQPGTGVIIHGNEVHYGIPASENSMLRAVLIFDPALIADRPSAVAALQSISQRSFFSLSSSDSISVELLLKEIEEEKTTRSEGWNDLVACNLEKFLVYIARASTSLNQRGLPKPNGVLLEILSYLESTFRQKQAVEDLCTRFAMSPSALRRLFKKHTGLGVKEFIILMRIAESKRLLEQSDAKVAVVAYEVGFDNLSAFNRDFKLATGMSPSEYRRLTVK